MSNLSLFLKGNKKQKGNAKYAATKSLCDESGNPLEWEIRPLSSKENERIRDNCMREVPITGKPGQYRNKFDSSKYIAQMLCASVVEPSLYNKELQDSYGVKTPEDLLLEMVDDAGEYMAFTDFIQRLNGFDDSLQEKVDKAKN